MRAISPLRSVIFFQLQSRQSDSWFPQPSTVGRPVKVETLPWKLYGSPVASKTTAPGGTQPRTQPSARYSPGYRCLM